MVGDRVLQHKFWAPPFRWVEVACWMWDKDSIKPIHLLAIFFFLSSLLISSQGPCSLYGPRRMRGGIYQEWPFTCHVVMASYPTWPIGFNTVQIWHGIGFEAASNSFNSAWYFCQARYLAWGESWWNEQWVRLCGYAYGDDGREWLLGMWV